MNDREMIICQKQCREFFLTMSIFVIIIHTEIINENRRVLLNYVAKSLGENCDKIFTQFFYT